MPESTDNGPWCFDLNDTISSTPELMMAMMVGLREAGHEVHVVSGTHHNPATLADLREKQELLDKLGLEKGTHYDKLVAVSGPESAVAERKVQYMRHTAAAGLVDNAKANIKAAKKAGFLGLLHVRPEGTPVGE
jgi:hypothetical protein